MMTGNKERKLEGVSVDIVRYMYALRGYMYWGRGEKEREGEGLGGGREEGRIKEKEQTGRWGEREGEELLGGRKKACVSLMEIVRYMYALGVASSPGHSQLFNVAKSWEWPGDKATLGEYWGREGEEDFLYWLCWHEYRMLVPHNNIAHWYIGLDKLLC